MMTMKDWVILSSRRFEGNNSKTTALHARIFVESRESASGDHGPKLEARHGKYETRRLDFIEVLYGLPS